MLKPSSRHLSQAFPALYQVDPPRRTLPHLVIVVSLGVLFGTMAIMTVLLLHAVLAVHPLS